MILFVNGDEHVAGAWITNNYIYADEDQKYNYKGKRPHPGNLKLSWGSKLAIPLVMKPDTIAPQPTNTDIINSTNKWIERVANRLAPSDVFIILGWVDPADDNDVTNIRNYHLYLNELEIKHIFFDTTHKINFNFNFKDVYINEVYTEYLKRKGFNTVIMSDMYFGKDAHSEWANHLLKHIVKNKIL